MEEMATDSDWRSDSRICAQVAGSLRPATEGTGALGPGPESPALHQLDLPHTREPLPQVTENGRAPQTERGCLVLRGGEHNVMCACITPT